MHVSGTMGALRRISLSLALAASVVFGHAAQAQTTDQQTTTPTPAPTPAPAAPAATPSAPAPAPQPPATATTPAPAAPSTAGNPDRKGAAPGDASISQTIDVQPRPAAVLSGSATWDEGFKTLSDTFAKLNDVMSKNGLTAAGRPLAVFTSTDDAGFKFSAMIPIAQAPEGKTELTPEIKIGETPSGKAIRFQHRASYDDIDSTYEAITAYLDEKGLESRNLFAEEYLKQTKTSDDPTLEVDIYVFLK